MAYMTPPRQQLGDYGTFDTFDGPDGLGLRLFKKKKKKAPAKPAGAVGVLAPLAPKRKKKKKKPLLRRIGKGILKVAPVAAGIFLPGAGAVAVGAASGLIGRGKPKLKNVLRGAAIAGGTSIVKGAIKSGQAGRILVKGKKALGVALKGGGKVVGKVASGTGDAISNIAQGKIGAKESAILALGGGAVAVAAKKLIGGGGGEVTDESMAPGDPGTVDAGTPVPLDEGPGPYPPSGMPPIPTAKEKCEEAGGTFDPVRMVCVMPNGSPPPQTGGGYPGTTDEGGQGPVPGQVPSPVDTPTSGQIPVAGGTIPDTATGALFPGSGGDTYTPGPFTDTDQDGVPDEEEAKAESKKKALLIAAGIAAVVILTRKRGKKGA